MKRVLFLALSTFLLAGVLLADTPAKKATALRCTLTGQTVEKCCCEQRGDKLYCPLAKKEISKCCCVPAKAEKGKKK